MSRHVLAIGSHPDDVEIGCGGTMIRHRLEGDSVTMLIVTNGEAGPGSAERRVSEQHSAAEVLGVEKVIFGDLPDCYVSSHELELVHLIERAIEATDADVIYTHSASDSHQDHRAIAGCTMGAARFRPTILTYSAPSSLAFAPTVYVDISDTIEGKVAALQCHASQVAGSDMVSIARIRAQAAAYGHDVGVASAEAFVPQRLLVHL